MAFMLSETARVAVPGAVEYRAEPRSVIFHSWLHVMQQVLYCRSQISFKIIITEHTLFLVTSHILVSVPRDYAGNIYL